MPIYTRTGDDGTTTTSGGKRLLKCEELVDAYGSLDELNSWVGLIVSKLKYEHIKDFLCTIQSDLFLIGGALTEWKTNLSQISSRVTQIEVEIDALESKMPKINNFVLPGGTDLASHLHIARSIARRVERQVVALSKTQKVDPSIKAFLNRLSDLFFVLARYINKEEKYQETIWEPDKSKG